MTPAQRNVLLSMWIKPSSDHEKDRQERARHMVAEAIAGWKKFDDTDYDIYTKGSYRNRTNVKLDSDVDIAIDLKECVYYDFISGVNESEVVRPASYSGSWTPESWRSEVVKALESYFGKESINTAGRLAINIPEVKGSRPSIDIVPSFEYIRYDDAAQSASNTNYGSCVFPKDGGRKTVNWPQQQYDNGVKKNDITGKRYKFFVRALKNAENALVDSGDLKKALPSYFMECLVYNAADHLFNSANDDLETSFGKVLNNIAVKLDSDNDFPMVEPNELKYLFRGDKKWTIAEGKELIARTQTMMGY